MMRAPLLCTLCQPAGPSGWDRKDESTGFCEMIVAMFAYASIRLMMSRPEEGGFSGAQAAGSQFGHFREVGKAKARLRQDVGGPVQNRGWC